MPDAPVLARRIRRGERLGAIARLLNAPAGQERVVVERFLAAAPGSGIDPDLIWWAGEEDEKRGPIIRQAVLAVPGAGRTATAFLSGPASETLYGSSWIQRADRVACLEAMCGEVAEVGTPGGADAGNVGSGVALVQALVEPTEHWCIDALDAAGFQSVGLLEYMSRAMEPPAPPPEPKWPEGVTITPVSELGDPAAWWPRMVAALEASYEATLDCPELCGLRETSDVLESHRATGRFDPRFWWLIERGGEPVGCCLMSLVPAQRTVELVYIGMSPRVRGFGLGRSLLTHALCAVSRLPADDVVLAVDTRNAPAARIYAALGFAVTMRRVGYVRRVVDRGAGRVDATATA